jgi:hypothetical protein
MLVGAAPRRDRELKWRETVLRDSGNAWGGDIKASKPGGDEFLPPTF